VFAPGAVFGNDVLSLLSAPAKGAPRKASLPKAPQIDVESLLPPMPEVPETQASLFRQRLLAAMPPPEPIETIEGDESVPIPEGSLAPPPEAMLRAFVTDVLLPRAKTY
jgi:hypothetical protein